ncbi:hypothetical protein HYQ45_018475 [Verticillium longisporum]|uniref:BZIP domain-containing protein n=1 Tax=Verticillium longisporum TaxID=100787 RepID=A0A8I2Z2J0_VERLO|nr:hypothetical protein HYQ45_018475 [Verticillium longisporum]
MCYLRTVHCAQCDTSKTHIVRCLAQQEVSDKKEGNFARCSTTTPLPTVAELQEQNCPTCAIRQEEESLAKATSKAARQERRQKRNEAVRACRIVQEERAAAATDEGKELKSKKCVVM